MRFEHSIEIGRSPADVYAYLADPRNLPEWQSAVEQVRVESEERFTEVRTFLGRRAESRMEVIAAEPGKEFSLRVASGPVKATVRHLLESTADGRTRLALEVEAEPTGIPRIAAGVAARAARRQSERDFARLKEILERDAGTS